MDLLSALNFGFGAQFSYNKNWAQTQQQICCLISAQFLNSFHGQPFQTFLKLILCQGASIYDVRIMFGLLEVLLGALFGEILVGKRKSVVFLTRVAAAVEQHETPVWVAITVVLSPLRYRIGIGTLWWLWCKLWSSMVFPSCSLLGIVTQTAVLWI